MSLEALDHLVPGDDTLDDALRAALAHDAAKRLRRALAAWTRSAARAPTLASFAGVDPGSGAFRTWLAEVEDTLAVASLARRIVAIPRARRRSHRSWPRLIDAIADAGVLAKLAPKGSIPDAFATRALAHARIRLAASARDARGLARHAAGELEIGRVLVERGLEIVEGRRDARFERRVKRAHEMLEVAWPEGRAMVERRTWRIVPVTAWATVSYSSARQPGILYIDVASSPLVRLAEDLVHESTHARVHELEALYPLVVRAARETSARGEPRFYSPWRREWRPLRGLVHATCTFTAGAMFFERMLAARGLSFTPARRRWLSRRLLEERASVAVSLRVLRSAERAGLLTEAGRRVAAAAAREHRALARAAASRRAGLDRSAAGRLELARLARWEASLRRRPVRWSWA